MRKPARHTTGITSTAAAALTLLLYAGQASGAMPSFDEVREDFRSSDTLVLSREGDVLQRQRTDTGVRRGSWVQLADVSPALRTALVLSEDQRFYAHSGIDWRAVSAAAWANVWNTKTRGASTLTMQLAGLLDADWRVGPGGRTLTQKIGQALAAQSLERHWRKDQILEAYLNLVPLRGDLVGVDALARSLFNTAPSGLGAREAAVTVALVRSPNAAPQRVAQRACGVLKQLESGPVDCNALGLYVTAALQQRSLAASEGVAPHAARQAMQQATPPLAGQSIRSTLRASLQRFAVNTLQQQLRELRQRHVEDGAIVVLDNTTGDVLAWVGSSGALSAASEVDGVLARRQPGSTLKPFLYGQAIAERRLTAASLLDDAPANIATGAGLYIPQNYDHQFRGWTSVRTALAASLNVPAVRTLVMVSPESFHQQLAAVGLPLQESGDFYGYSLALGSAEVSLLNLTNSYRTLANLGQASPTRLLLAPNAGRPSLPPPAASPPPLEALDARAAFIVGDILSDPIARAPTFGTDSVLATRFWSAVKTGTSKDMRDNWALGWSQRYTVGVWVGNASGAPMWDVSGTSGAAPIWAAVMGYLHRREPSRAPAVPPGLVQQEVQFGQQLEAARTEWFIKGTEQSLFAVESGAPGAFTESAAGPNGLSSNVSSEGARTPSTGRITAPTSGTILALDPDIPPKQQRLRLTATGPHTQWRVDGKPLARGAEVMWSPWPGRHKIQLVDARGTLQDEVQVEVRGAGIKAGSAQGVASKGR